MEIKWTSYIISKQITTVHMLMIQAHKEQLKGKKLYERSKVLSE